MYLHIPVHVAQLRASFFGGHPQKKQGGVRTFQTHLYQFTTTQVKRSLDHDVCGRTERLTYVPLILHLHLYYSPPHCCAFAETDSQDEEIQEEQGVFYNSDGDEVDSGIAVDDEEDDENDEEEEEDAFESEDDRPIRRLGGSKNKQKSQKRRRTETQQASVQTPLRQPQKKHKSPHAQAKGKAGK